MGKKRKGIMLCYPFEEKRLNKWNTWTLVQPKLDGIRCRALFTREGVKLLSSTETPINYAPQVVQDLTKMARFWISNGILELDGELYNHELSFQQQRRKENYPSLQYHIFDFYSKHLVCTDRLIFLKGLRDLPDNIKIVETVRADNLEQIAHLLSALCLVRYEGIVIRHPYGRYKRSRSTDIMKFKPHQTDTYRVVDIFEEKNKEGVPKGRLGGVVCVDEDGESFSVGSGFGDEERERYWLDNNLILDKKIVVKYQAKTERGVPRFGIFLEIKEVK